MSDGTLQPTSDAISSCSFDVEYTSSIKTGEYRSAVKFTDFPRISTLKSLFASVMVEHIEAEVRQNSMEGTEEGQIQCLGHIYVAIIPTNKDADHSSGSSNAIVNNVPNKQTFPISSVSQMNSVFQFNLKGYELDLAQDPRRGAGPVAWLGNSGITKTGEKSASKTIATATWRLKVRCSGSTPLWQ